MPVLTGIIPMKYVIAYDNVTWNRTVGLIRVSWKKLYVYWWKKKKKKTQNECNTLVERFCIQRKQVCSLKFL